LAAEQARLTYRMGLRLLMALTDALGLAVDGRSRKRLTEAKITALAAALEASAITWRIGPREMARLLRLARRYEIYLVPLSEWLVIPLPDWAPAAAAGPEDADVEDASS